jgi:hypothetical protein
MAKVDFINNADDADCFVQASIGLYSRAIGRTTGMTACRAQYRVWKSGGSVERKAWREGRSPWVSSFLKVIAPDVREQLKATVLKELEQQQKKVRPKRGSVIKAKK